MPLLTDQEIHKEGFKRQKADEPLNDFNIISFKEGAKYARNLYEERIRELEAKLLLLSRMELDCDHTESEPKNLRCTCCKECGEILDVID